MGVSIDNAALIPLALLVGDVIAGMGTGAGTEGIDVPCTCRKLYTACNTACALGRLAGSASVQDLTNFIAFGYRSAIT